MGAQLGAEFLPFHEQLHRGIGAEQREAQRQGGVAEIAAANIQQPGDGMRVGQHGGILASSAQGGGGGFALLRRIQAGIFSRVDAGGGQGGGWAVRPDRINGVARQGYQGDANVAGQRGLGVQPGVVADGRTRRRNLAQPFRGGLFDEVAALPQRGFGLLRDLGGVAAIGEDRRAAGQHHGQAGAAGEAGEPGQALARGGDVFAQELVAAGDQKAIHPLGCKLGAEGGEAFSGGHDSNLAWNGAGFQ